MDIMQAYQIDLVTFEWNIVAKVSPRQLLASQSSDSRAKTMQEKRHHQIGKVWETLTRLGEPLQNGAVALNFSEGEGVSEEWP